MTAVLPRASEPGLDGARGPRTVPWHRVAHGVLLSATAVLYLWGLSASGWANAFYSAAAQAGAQSWTAMLFGSSDAGNAITVDKTPGALWVMDVSVRLFGLNPWSVLVPQALMGVATVAVLSAAVRRAAGPWAGLLAGAVCALTPAAVLMFRFNNPDALLVLALVVGAYCVQRACVPDAGRWWLVGAGVAVGIGFLAKMVQAFLVLPGFGLAYLLTAAVPWRTRARRLAAGTLAMVVTAGWYLVLVEAWPASQRPYVGGSQHDSVLELALGYNGVGRLTGNEVGGLGNMNFDVGWGRLLGASMGDYAGWLLPAALIGLGATIVVARRTPRTDPLRTAAVTWGGWLLVTAAVFSFANGILHQYYTVALAPAIGATVGIGATVLWRNRSDVRAAAAMAAAVAGTAVLAVVLLARQADWQPWLRGTIAVAGLVAAVLLVVVARLPGAVARLTAVLAVAACLLGPGAYAVATAASPHSGAIPSVGPARGGGFGSFGGGLLDSPDVGDDVARLVRTDAGSYRWAAAVVGSNNAAGYQLATGVPVMAVGGFNGTDPAPTLSEFQQLVAQRQVHYFVNARVMGGFGGHGRGGSSGSQEAAHIAEWVRTHFRPVAVESGHPPVEIYDLTAPDSTAPDS